jgi:hypothetical protein
MRAHIRCLQLQGGERERGSVSAEIALVIGLVLAVSFGAVQYALDAFAKQAARAAAADGLAAAQAQDGDVHTATARAGDILAQLTGDLHSPAITVHRTATEASITITGTASSLFGLTQRVTVTESGPVERFLGADS